MLLTRYSLKNHLRKNDLTLKKTHNDSYQLKQTKQTIIVIPIIYFTFYVFYFYLIY